MCLSLFLSSLFLSFPLSPLSLPPLSSLSLSPSIYPSFLPSLSLPSLPFPLFPFSYATADNGSYMTVDDLLNFVHTEQDSDNATIEYCESVIDRYEPSETGLKQHLLSIDG